MLREHDLVILLFIMVFLLCFGTPYSYQDSQTSKTVIPTIQNNTFTFDADIGHGKHISLSLPTGKLLFKPIVTTKNEGNVIKSISLNFIEKLELQNLYHDIGNYNTNQKVVFIYPIFTQAAYGKNGFYDYYGKTCGSQCLTIPIPNKIKAGYSSSAKGSNVLNILNYSFITDIDVDQNPNILKNYDKIIVLHNEYVTKTEFKAITSHPHVIFLYPNSLYAKVSVNYNTNTITLLRGHGYPSPSINNGFDWKDDNSKYEYDYNCKNWNFYTQDGYVFLNCYPEYKMLYDVDLLRSLKSN